jgi:hypothetical protein
LVAAGSDNETTKMSNPSYRERSEEFKGQPAEFANANNVVVPLYPINISRDEFLEAAFLTAKGDVCLCTFTPSGHIQRRWEPGEDYGEATCPTYVNISTVRPAEPGTDRLTRRKEDCIETPLIYLDDIGTKVAADIVPCEPSYILETSPGNCQYGYFISPAAQPDEVAALLRCLAAKGLTDPGALGATRIGRVPGSLNGKPQHGGWRATLRTWHPERTWTLDALTAALGVSAEEFAEALAAERGEYRDALARRGDPNDPPKPEFLALEDVGLILGRAGSGKDLERAWFLRCPGADPGGWDGDTPGHTPGAADGDVAKVWETGGFKCHHASCAERNFNDLAKWVAEHPDAGPALQRIKRERPSPFEPVPDTDSEPIERRTAAERDQDLVDIGAGVGMAPLPARERVSDLLAIGEPAMIAAPSGFGKSMRVVGLVSALAAERHDLVGESAPFERIGGIVVVSNEDTPQDFLKRRNAWLKHHGLSAADLKHSIKVTKRPGFIVARGGNGASIELGEDMKWLAGKLREFREAGEETSLLVIDTQASHSPARTRTQTATWPARMRCWAAGPKSIGSRGR